MKLLPGLAMMIAATLILLGCSGATLPIRDDKERNSDVAHVNSPAPKARPSTGTSGG